VEVGLRPAMFKPGSLVVRLFLRFLCSELWDNVQNLGLTLGRVILVGVTKKVAPCFFFQIRLI